MTKLAWILALIFCLSSCGSVSGPCDDSDPVGICANAHGKVCTC